MSDSHRRWAYFLPNIFTALNMGCGFVGIMFSLQGDFYKASMILALGAVFDSVDGRIARLTGTESSFGEQFDSMSDLISFGMAPSILFYLRFLNSYGRIGMILSFVFLLCTAMRLARFNANLDRVSSDYFQGLPSPVSALALVGYTLFSLDFPLLMERKIYALFYIVLYAFLMISNIPFPSFKNSEWVKKHRRQTLLIIFLIMSLVLIYEKITIGLVLSLYVICSLTYVFLNRKKFKGIFDFEHGSDHT